MFSVQTWGTERVRSKLKGPLGSRFLLKTCENRRNQSKSQFLIVEIKASRVRWADYRYDSERKVETKIKSTLTR